MKHHNNLTDSQIHNAKGFEPARKRSISSKNASGNVEWIKGNYNSTITLVCLADLGGSLHHTYFCLYNSYDALKFAVYINITGGEAMATPAGYDGVIACDASATGVNSTLQEIGNAVQLGVDANTNFTATDNNLGIVTITGNPDLTTTTPVVDVDSGFVFSIANVELADEVLTTDSGGNFKFTSLTNVAADKNYVHNQGTPAEVWTVTHNLGKNPSVTVVDSAGTVVIGQVDYNSINQTTLTFKATFSGKAYFN
tara:strand:- start:33 stop:794 length:762 start_codon:yes stop_codon:yes gene_type:complete